MDPRVCIIVLNWNGLADTIECLDSLRQVTSPGYQVIVVDNGSAGNDADTLATRYGDYIHLIRNDRNCGFAEGNNIAIRYALQRWNPDYVLLLNNDTVVHPAFLDKLVEVAEGDHSIGIAGPKIYFHGRQSVFQSAGARTNLWTGRMKLIGFGETDAGQYDRLADVDWVVGCGLLIRSKVIERIGLLYPGYFALYEETEWCLRCRKAGYRVVYVPGSVLWHKGEQATARVSGFRMYYTGRNSLLFMRRNASALQFAAFCLQFPVRDVPMTTAWLLFRLRDTRSLLRYYAGIRDGIRLVLKTGKDFKGEGVDLPVSPGR